MNANIKSRAQIITEVRRMRDESQQIITDTNHWNDSVRKPHEAPIDPDPNGELGRIIKACDETLSREKYRDLEPGEIVCEGDGCFDESTQAYYPAHPDFYGLRTTAESMRCRRPVSVKIHPLKL